MNEASKCIKLNDNLSLGSVEVVDWKENGELGALRIATAIEESPYTPCEHAHTPWTLKMPLFIVHLVCAGFVESLMETNHVCSYHMQC